MRRSLGLLLLFFASIAIRIGLEHWTESLGWANLSTVARNAFSSATTTTLAIGSSLIPSRYIVGLVLVVGFNAACVLVESIVGTQHSFSAWSSVQNVAVETACGLVILMIFQGLRLFFGWRITADFTAVTKKRGQFRLSELIEWTITWALLLAMHKLSNSLATSSVSTAAQFAVMLLQELLFAGPIAYLMLRPKLNAASFALSVVAAAAATVIWMLAHGSY